MKTVREFLELRRSRRSERKVEAWLESRRWCFSQGDQSIANQAGAAFRADLNVELQALVSGSSGATAPATTYAYQIWNDTTTGLRKQRNAANSGWIIRGELAETRTFSRSSNTILGLADFGCFFTATAGFTQTLTAAATLGDGWRCFYRIETGGTVTFDPNSSETIDGSTTKVVAGPSSGVIFCDGTNFKTIGFPSSSSAGTTWPRGRITLTSATPITTADVTGATTVYYALHNGNTVPITTDGATFTDTTFTELSQATTDNTKSPAAVAASKMYDLFVWSDTGTMRCTRGPAWTNDTTPGTGAGTSELQQIAGIWTNKVAITNGPGANKGTYVGTIRSDASSQINDSAALRHVANAYNEVPRSLKQAAETADSWTYTTATYRQANANAANQLDYVATQLNKHPVFARIDASALNSSAGVSVITGIGIDSTSVNSASTTVGTETPTAGTARAQTNAQYQGYPGIGRHTLVWLEKSTAAGTTTWYGDNTAGLPGQTGIIGWIMG